MISDTVFEAISEIEDYQKNFPHLYEDWREHIDLVKKVMASLLESLDQPPFEYGLWYERLLNAALTADERQRWRCCCEAGITRWAERLRLVGPVSPDELVDRLADAVERQAAMLGGHAGEEGRATPRRLLLTCLFVSAFIDDIGAVRDRLAHLFPLLEADHEAMPVDACKQLGLPPGSTYAEGVCAVRSALAAPAK